MGKLSHYYNPRPVRIFTSSRRSTLAKRWDFVPGYSGPISSQDISKIENYIKVWNLSATVRQLYSFLLPYYRYGDFSYSDYWLLDTDDNPSALNNLCWHVECPSCNLVSIRQEKEDIISELGIHYSKASIDVTSWMNIIARERLTARQFFDLLRPLMSEIEMEGMSRSDWSEREADSSVRYDPPDSALSTKVASLFVHGSNYDREYQANVSSRSR
ncbi:hypothetical protein ACOME3_008775 [Neoechinorhynchus agilis]